MAKLEDQGQRGLPPPPAPPRRGANPWKFSDTAKKREPEAPRVTQRLEDILDELQQDQDAQAPARPPQPAPPTPQPATYQSQPASYQPAPEAKKGGSSAWPLFILLIAVAVIVKVVSQAAETGEWRSAIAPLIAIVFIAHGWWRMRQRRDQKPDSDAEK